MNITHVTKTSYDYEINYIIQLSLGHTKLIKCLVSGSVSWQDKQKDANHYNNFIENLRFQMTMLFKYPLTNTYLNSAPRSSTCM